MISIICFIVVIFGSMNWLSIGFFQYDIVAGLFGYQGSIFSRLVYIVVGICAIYLIFVIIKNKGRLTVNKLKKEEQPIVDKITKKDAETIENDKKIAESIKILSKNKDYIENQNENLAFVNNENQIENLDNSQEDITHFGNVKKHTETEI